MDIAQTITDRIIAELEQGTAPWVKPWHEAVHATGHASRLDRKLANKFGSEAYAFEELIAELGAAMLCMKTGVDGQLQHASYIESWLKVLKQDKNAIIRAASKAQAAMDYLVAEQAIEMPLAA